MIHSCPSRAKHLCMALVAAAVVGCGGSDSPTSNGNGNGGGGGGGNPVATTSVSVQNNSFSPSAIRVTPGATVTWTWGGRGHNVTWTGSNTTALQDSATRSSGTHQVTMPATAGTYNYECTLHPGMNGSVTVGSGG
ncbi:MAG: hypothetical protein EXR92_02400 [Gemmatimonadetes bacterium]|nr:hypothetical protein [Gemmatimonadota bacterium]